MAFNFGEVLSRAWQITWKYKILWIFGILAGCGRGGGGSNSGSRISQDMNNGQGQQNWQLFWDQASRWLEANWWIVVVLILLFLVLVLLSIFLGTIGRIGLIRGTLQAETGAGPLTFGNIWRDSMPHFWPVFGLSFLIGLIFFFIFLMLILGAVITAGIGLICLLPLFCVLLPIAIVINVIVEQANVAIVKEHLGLVEGWKRGWDVARRNPGPIAVMALILLVIGFVIGLIIAIPIFIIMIPAAVAFVMANGQNWTPMLIAGGLFLLYLPILLLLQGILTTFTGSAWVLTYLRLTTPPVDNTPVVVEANA